MEVTYNRYSLIVDGKRVIIKSGAFHYFRTPGESMARDRFLKMKVGGYNAVDIYFNWNYHSSAPGKYDFSGIKDVRKVLKAARDAGLFVIARPGPFINAEVNAGGLPFWLLKMEDVVPRNRVGTEYKYSPKYMEYISEWYDHIIPIINEFDNVILFQIENEYATDTMEEDYMRQLYKMARDRGVTCPIFHNDAYFAGLWADCVDIYALDLYPYINPNQNWKQDTFCFDTLDNVEDIFRNAKEDSPPFIAEMQAGWFDKWDGSGYQHIRDALGDEHINIMTKTALSQGVTLFNHYMAVGGTNWDDLACDEVYTSYEFTAPIDEFGVFQPNFYKAKEINYFLDSFDLTCTEPKDFDFYQENIYTKLRHDLNNNCDWLFIRNLGDTQEISLPDEKTVHIKSYDMKICPINLNLMGCKIEFSDVEIFARLKNESEEAVFFISDNNSNIYLSDGTVISGKQKDFANYKFEKDGKKTQFIFLTKSLADRSWFLGDKIIFNADYVLPNGAIAVEKNTEIAYFDLKYKFGRRNCIVTEFKNTKDVVPLEISKVEFCAPEIDTDYDYSGWKKISDKTDAFSCDMYDEFIWYKAQIPKDLTEITLSARHLFAVYINGKEIINRNSYKLEKLQEVPETLSVPLNNQILNKDKNELTILVQNLGFDKGFSGDTNSPRGLVLFETTPKVPVEFYVQDKLAIERSKKYESENPYLAKITANFDVDLKENTFLAKYISFEDFRCRRATIFLNGVKIGRYIKRRHVQEKFYLINEFLKPHNTIEIVVWEKDRNVKSAWGFKSDLKNVIIKLGTFKKCQIFK